MHKSSLIKTILTAIPLSFLSAAGAQDAVTEEKITDAINSEIRSAEDVERDFSRKPLETLSFFGLTDNMRVVEILPGGGWYSKILAPVLEEKGQLYLSLNGSNTLEMLKQLGFGAQLAEKNVVSERAGRGAALIKGMDLGIEELDMALTFRNLHNFSPEARIVMHKGILDALKPGGIYGVVDHTKRHMQPAGGETWRRLDPVQVIQEITAAGFEFVDFSGLHYRADDELKYDTEWPSINRYSDRFTLKFKRPE
jgi:predicted methyltransferase